MATGWLKKTLIPREYPLIDVKEPNLFRDLFTYDEVPKIGWDFVEVPIDMPNEVFITDTTFRDGQQAKEPYTLEQIGTLYDYMHKLGGPNGKIRWSEFFLYTERDRKAVQLCRERGYDYPKVTGWIRASKEDFKVVKEMELEETGILTSISDYHIFYKFNSTRSQVVKKHLEVAEEALKSGIVARCHLEDVTRADIFGTVLPFVRELMKLSEKYGLPVKIRLADTLGVGVPFPEASLPRSIPKLIHVLKNQGGLPSEHIEFHGHNDFALVIANAMSAWLYGAAANNGALFGSGERTGNTPIEQLVIAYAQLRGTTDGMDTRVITELANYWKTLPGVIIPPYYPIIGSKFNVTSAGIHADGLVKNPEIYLPFDTDKVLNNPPGINVSAYSGVAGIIFWIQRHFRLREDELVDKKESGVLRIHEEISKQYAEGRVSAMSDAEMEALVKQHLPEVWRKYSNRIQK